MQVRLCERGRASALDACLFNAMPKRLAKLEQCEQLCDGATKSQPAAFDAAYAQMHNNMYQTHTHNNKMTCAPAAAVAAISCVRASASNCGRPPKGGVPAECR